MTHLLPSESDSKRWQAGDEVVNRTIRGDWSSIRSALTDRAAFAGVPMHLDEPFERVDRVVVEIWRASGRIERAGRTERIEIEVTQASSWSAELRVLPWKQRRYRWGRRQQEILVHLADQLADVLAGPTTEADRVVDLTADVPRVIDLTSPAVPSTPALGLGID